MPGRLITPPVQDVNSRTNLTPPAMALTSLAIFAALLALAWAIFGDARHLPPVSGDNLYILDWAARTSASTVLAGEPAFYPEWRPLAYFTVWLQYQWAGLAHTGSYFIVNLLLWTCTAWMVWRVAVSYGVASWLALVAGARILTDTRAVFAVTWINERQMSLACVFGLGALLLSTSDKRKPGHQWQALALTLLLLASALSKEFGLAFAVTVGYDAWRRRRLDRGLATLAALLVYAVLRIAVTYGAPMRLCEEMGYFGELRTVCFSPVTGAVILQALHNVIATAGASLLPGILGGDGRLAVSPFRMGLSVVWLTLAAVGWWRGSTTSRPTWTLILATAALNFMLYRSRNHLVALCAVSIAAAAGLQILTQAAVWQSRRARAALAAGLAGLLIVDSVRTNRAVSSVVEQERVADPCAELGNIPNLKRGFVRRVKLRYGLADPDCEQESSGRQ